MGCNEEREDGCEEDGKDIVRQQIFLHSISIFFPVLFSIFRSFSLHCHSQVRQIDIEFF